MSDGRKNDDFPTVRPILKVKLLAQTWRRTIFLLPFLLVSIICTLLWEIWGNISIIRSLFLKYIVFSSQLEQEKSVVVLWGCTWVHERGHSGRRKERVDSRRRYAEQGKHVRGQTQKFVFRVRHVGWRWRPKFQKVRKPFLLLPL